VLHFTDSQQTESLLYVGEAWDLSELDYRLVEVFCTNVSIGFENLHLNQELFDAQLEMIFLLASAAESRSRETAAHVRRVGELAGLLRQALRPRRGTADLPAPCRAAARHRQDRHSRRHPQQAGQAHAGRIGGDAHARRDRPPACWSARTARC
jgi:response regulator RpfG family c-di-GMP phosphodiesterase